MNGESAETMWLLSEKQLKLLLAGLGYEQIYGLFSSDEPVGRAEIVQGLMELADGNAVRLEDECVRVCAPLQQLLQRIAGADRLVLLRLPREGQLVCCCCGEGDELAVWQPVEYAAGFLRLSVLRVGEMMERLLACSAFCADPAPGAQPEEELLWEQSAQALLQAEAYESRRKTVELQIVQTIGLQAEIIVQWPGQPRPVLPYRKADAVELTAQLLRGEGLTSMSR